MTNSRPSENIEEKKATSLKVHVCCSGTDSRTRRYAKMNGRQGEIRNLMEQKEADRTRKARACVFVHRKHVDMLTLVANSGLKQTNKHNSNE